MERERNQNIIKHSQRNCARFKEDQHYDNACQQRQFRIIVLQFQGPEL